MHKWTSFLLFAATLAHTGIAAAQETASEPVAEQPKVILDADNIFVNEADNSVIAEGNVEAKYEGRILRADRLIYFRETDRVRAIGNVIVIDAQTAVRSFANEIETSSNLIDGYAIGFSTRTPEGGVAVAESAVRSSEGYNALEKIVYTSCEVCDEDDRPTWALRARRAVLDEQSEMMSYRDAVLEVAGVPVLYLPFFAHPDPSSGVALVCCRRILAPRQNSASITSNPIIGRSRPTPT